MTIDQYDIFLISLDPATGHEIKKTRPCVVISPDEMNNMIPTLLVAPMTTKPKEFPTRIPIYFQSKEGWIVLDQIKTIDKRRIFRRLGRADQETIKQIKAALYEMLVK